MNIQNGFPLGWRVESPWSPRDSQESSPTPQFKRINSSAPSFLYSPALTFIHDSCQFSSVAQSRPTLCDPMNRNTPGLPVHQQLPEFTQIHVHQVGDAIQPSHPLYLVYLVLNVHCKMNQRCQRAVVKYSSPSPFLTPSFLPRRTCS